MDPRAIKKIRAGIKAKKIVSLCKRGFFGVYPWDFSTLDIHHPLFRILKSENPPWWQFIRDQIKSGSFYVDIRKDNSINIYYNGGSMLRVVYSRGRIRGKIHAAYLGGTGSKYVDYPPERLPNDAESINRRIALRFGNLSESGIKAKLISDPDARFIDSEFAYPELIGKTTGPDGKIRSEYRTTRIDLTKIENGKIVFVELKRIEDARLLTKDYANGSPEILTQMKSYYQFVKEHKDEITTYYKKLFYTKSELQLLPPTLAGITDIADHDLADHVELHIEPYSRMNPARIRRTEAIKILLD